MLKRIKSNSAFMGSTHAASALAGFFLVVSLAPDFFFSQVGTDSVPIILASLVTVGGAAMFPDFDNTKSTAISSMGIFGVWISKLLRRTSVIVYSITKTRHDNKDSNPHRGFWHTIVSGVFLGFLIFISTSIKQEIILFDRIYEIGFLIACLWVFLFSRLFIAIFFSKKFKKMKSKGITGKILSIVISILFTAYLIISTNHMPNYYWLAFSASLGHLFHIMGDTMTVSGAPIIWPIKIKGKRWYDIRFTKMKAGGDIEKMIILPTFIILAIFGIGKTILEVL